MTVLAKIFNSWRKYFEIVSDDFIIIFFQAYDSCSSRKDAELLLQNIPVSIHTSFDYGFMSI